MTSTRIDRAPRPTPSAGPAGVGVGRTSAGRWAPPRFGRFTFCCTARTSARSAGSGSHSTQSATPTRRYRWLAVARGGRRAELCALQWGEVDLDRAAVTLKRAVAKNDQGRWCRKGTKTHQQRRVALDPVTVGVLAAQRDRYTERYAALGVPTQDTAYVFSLAPDHATFLIPESVSQRFSRLAVRLGVDASIHALRHYNATELIAAGVDPRTVAGRLGHGGGITTLRIYSAFQEEANQRAAAALSPRMPTLPAPAPESTERAKTDPRTPHERIAAALRQRILAGELPNGDPTAAASHPSPKSCAPTAPPTAPSPYSKTWGLVEGTAGRRTVVTYHSA